MKKLTLHALQTVVLVSHANLETFQSVFGNAGQPRLTVIPNGIPIRATDPDRSRARQHVRSLCGAGSFEHIVITVAALNNQKGHVILLQAAPLVLAHYPSTAFLCIGDGHLRSFLEQSRDSSGLKEKVFFAGIRRDIPRLLEGADLFVLPSLFEGMPLSVLEAMAAGCTVVATAVDGTREVVLHETTGLLVPAGDPKALAESIVRLLGNPSYCARLARAARHRVESEFAVQTMGFRYLRVYEDLLAGKEERTP
jgi:glycosyltransferase involved in cell wall biosynthesis